MANSVDSRLSMLAGRKFIQIPGPNPILISGGEKEWDGNFIECCNVFKDGEMYYLYYHGYPKDKDAFPRDGYRLGVAYASHPLGPWRKHDANPIIDLGDEGSWEDGYVACAAVLKEREDSYYMFYTGNYKVGLAYAKHPLGPWTKYDGNPIIDSNFGYVGGVVKVNGRYYMFNEYPVGSDFPSPDQGPMALATAERPEGPWTPYEGNPVLDPGEWGSWEDGGYSEAGVLYHDDIFHMFYGGTKWAKFETIGYACSADGKKWIKHVDNPVAPRENNPDASAFAEVHAIWEYPFYYLYHTHRYSSRAELETWAEDIGVQVLSTGSPFQITVPLLQVDSIEPNQASNMDNPLYEDGRTKEISGCAPLSLAAARSCSITIRCTYPAGTEKGLRIHVQASTDGIRYDTEDYATWELPLDRGKTVGKTCPLDVSAAFIKVQVENLDKGSPVKDVRILANISG